MPLRTSRLGVVNANDITASINEIVNTISFFIKVNNVFITEDYITLWQTVEDLCDKMNDGGYIYEF